MISEKSTFRLLPLTDGQRDNKQMVDTHDFEARLSHALIMNGLDNASFARLIGENGQQNIRAWKDRGRVGVRSERRVQELLAKTNMEWLQHGTGSPERFNSVAEPSPNYDVRQARSVRPVPEMLSAAYQYALYGLGRYVERRDLNLAFVSEASILCDVYALIANGGGELPGGQESSELRAIIEKHAGPRGKEDDRAEDPEQRPGNGAK
jgi:hypothetical protein